MIPNPKAATVINPEPAWGKDCGGAVGIGVGPWTRKVLASV